MAVRRFLVAGRYRLYEPVGSGGMGRVWMARDEMLDRDVAVKEFVPPDWMTDAEKNRLRDRTLREARSAARLNHPHVVRIYDVVHAEDLPWIVMEYVPSRSLYQVIKEDGPFTPIAAARIGLAVLDALNAAHRAGVLHRDIKAHNVLIGNDGRVVLTDFGLATFVDDGSVTGPGLVVGSPQYVSPERARDGASTVESDLWSFGATLYAAVEGRSPYARDGAMATLMALATEEPDPPVAAGPLAPVLIGLLRHEPSERLTAGEVEERLRSIVGAQWPAPALSRSTAGRRVSAGRAAVVPAPRRPSDENRASDPEADAAGPNGVGPNGVGPNAVGPKGVGPKGVGPKGVGPKGAAPNGKAALVAASSADRNAAPATVGEPSAAPAVRKNNQPVHQPPPPRKPPVVEEEPFSAPPPDPATRRSRHGAVLAWALVVLLLAAVGLTVGWLVQRHDDTGQSALPLGPTPAPSSASAPATFSTAACAGPPGANAPLTPQPGASDRAHGFALLSSWHLYTDTTGFSVAVPDGWTYEHVGSTVCFRDPGNLRYLSIDPNRNPAGDPVQACKTEAARVVRNGGLPHYKLLSLASLPMQIKAADWEYTYQQANNRMHASTRWFASSGKGFALTWVARDFDWQINMPFRSAIISSFSATTATS